MTLLRRIGAVLAGAIVAWIPVAGGELIAHKLYPPPPGLNMRDMEQIKAYVATLPLTAMVIVLTAWLIGTIAGTLTAARIGRTPITAFVLGAILLAAGIYNSVVIPQPMWFSVMSWVIYVGGTVIGAKLGTPRRAQL